MPHLPQRTRRRLLTLAVVLASGSALSGTGYAQAAQDAPAPVGPSDSNVPSSTVSPRLQVTPSISALPESLHNPSKAQAPGTIHTYDYGVFDRDGGAPAGFGPVARYGIDRSAEDWSALRNKKLRDDWLDPLKYIPLNDTGDIYLTLSGDERIKNWYENRPFLGQQKPYDSGRFTVRGIYGADLHVGQHVRLYGELVNGDAAGWAAYGYNATYRTRLDVQQLFGEVTYNLFGAKSGLRFGRQEFLDAPNYVLYARETPDVPLSWNGVRGYMIWPRFRIDAFDFVQTNTTPQQLFHDNENYSARLFGGYASYAVPDFKFLGKPGHVFFDLFYLGYELGGSSAAIANVKSTTSGTTLRDNYGTRLWGKAGPVEFSLGGIYQGGQFRPVKHAAERDVEAYALDGFVGYRIPGAFGNPLVGVQGDVYSGGNYNKTTGSVGTYIAPYNPQTSYLDTTTYLAPSNLIDVTPTFEVTPVSAVTARLKLPFFWRDSSNDAVYGSSRVYTFRGKYTDSFVGATPQASVAWRVTRHLTWTNDIARFFASNALSQAGAKDGTYYLSTLDYKF